MLSYDKHATGRVIQRLRKNHGYSQEVLSGFAGIARTHLVMIENGTKNANVDTLWRIADALDVPLSELIRMVEDEINRKEK